MTYIHLSKDLSLAVTHYENICRGDNLSQLITFLIPLTVDELEVETATVYLHYIRPDGYADTVTLTPDETMYNSDYYKYSIPVTCELTRQHGDVRMWLEFYAGDPSNPTVRKSDECNLPILEAESMDECLGDCQIGALYQMQQDIRELKENPPSTEITEETDPTVSAWAKEPAKPSYTASEVGAVPAPSTSSVGQTIVVKAVDENGKPTEWETKDVIKELCESGGAGRDKKVTKEALTETTFEFRPYDELGGIPACLIPNIDATDGDTLTVTWDGVDYICTYHNNDSEQYYGNIGILGEGDDTGEPFVAAIDLPTTGNTMLITTNEGSHAVRITSETVETQPIDERFIPIIESYEVIDMRAITNNPIPPWGGYFSTGSYEYGNLYLRIRDILNRGKIPSFLFRISVNLSLNADGTVHDYGESTTTLIPVSIRSYSGTYEITMKYCIRVTAYNGGLGSYDGVRELTCRMIISDPGEVSMDVIYSPTINHHGQTETINPEHLPGVCLPVVEISEPAEEGVELSEEELAQLNNVLKLDSKMCIIYITDSDAYLPTVCRVMKNAGLIAGISYNWHENTWYQIGLRFDLENEVWLAFASCSGAQVSTDQISSAVENYLEENPVSSVSATIENNILKVT